MTNMALRPTDSSSRVSTVDGELAARAIAVLERNWLGHATVPSPALYPHQWSWDSACIAMGYARWNQERAQRELRSLFAGQWRNGLLPHIVFSDGGRYFPGPEFWQTGRSPDAPTAPETSGIVQPPVHATAVLEIVRHAPGREDALAFAAELQPKLVAWHDYLYRERDRLGDGLVEIWHPWESGMDNSPLWDAALARITPSADEIPDYERIDVQVADPLERPTNLEYDRYAFLVSRFRDCDYDPGRIRGMTPFAIRDVLFNSLLVQSSRDLAELSRLVGADGEPHEKRAAATAAAIDAQLWDPEHGMYVDRDLRAGEPVDALVGAGFAPLYAGVPDAERARLVVERLNEFSVRVDPSGGKVVPSVSVDEPSLDPVRYWRGPVWPIVNWIVCRGLRRYGYLVEAEEICTGLTELAAREGFWEHYNPLTGRGQGGERFAWTAGLVLALLADAE